MTVDQSAKDTETKDTDTTAKKDSGLGRSVAQSADPIDRVVRLAPKWTVFVLGACGLLVASIIIWAVAGTVTSSVSTPGLYREAGVEDVVSTTAATVDKVLVDVGQKVTKGQSVVTLTNGDTLISPQAGTITSVLVSGGSVMLAGKIAVRVTDLAQQDTVATVVPASMTGTVKVGLPVRIAVSSAPSSQYGYLLGHISSIAGDPYTTDQIATRLGLDVPVVAALLGTAPALLAIVTIDYDPTTPSNYRWSVGSGPPFTITQGVPITAQIVLSEEHPIQVVFPG